MNLTMQPYTTHTLTLTHKTHIINLEIKGKDGELHFEKLRSK